MNAANYNHASAMASLAAVVKGMSVTTLRERLAYYQGAIEATPMGQRRLDLGAQREVIRDELGGRTCCAPSWLYS